MHIDLVINYFFFPLLLLVFSESGYEPAVVSAILHHPLQPPPEITFPPPYLFFQWLRILWKKYSTVSYGGFFVMQSFNSLKLAVIPSTLILFTVCEQSAESKSALGLNRL